MLGFDIVMEPAAMYLQYWIWADSLVSIRNYIVWLLLGLFYAWTGVLLNIYKYLSALVLHTFIAQFVYFAMITLFFANN